MTGAVSLEIGVEPPDQGTQAIANNLRYDLEILNGEALIALEPGNLIGLRAHLLLQGRDLAQQRNNQSPQIFLRMASIIPSERF